MKNALGIVAPREARSVVSEANERMERKAEVRKARPAVGRERQKN